MSLAVKLDENLGREHVRLVRDRAMKQTESTIKGSREHPIRLSGRGP